MSTTQTPPAVDRVAELASGLRRIKGRIDAAKTDYKDQLRELRLICPHERVSECDYEPMQIMSALPPRRICETCGFEEEGWGCGYKVLTTDRLRKVSRSELYQMRLGTIHDT